MNCCCSQPHWTVVFFGNALNEDKKSHCVLHLKLCKKSSCMLKIFIKQLQAVDASVMRKI